MHSKKMWKSVQMGFWLSPSAAGSGKWFVGENEDGDIVTHWQHFPEYPEDDTSL
jgi:hypothetical protein